MNQSLDKAISGTMDRFAGDLRKIFGDDLLSLILFGSAVLGDFTPGKGDLDFMVITESAVTPDQCEHIFHLHDQMRNPESDILARQLEGTYYPLSIVVDPIHTNAPGCYIGTGRKGWKAIDASKNSLADYSIIKRYGKVCYGHDVIPLIYSPMHEELLDEFRATLEHSIRTANQIKDYYFALAMFHWAPRGLCMALTGQLLSKRQAAEWFTAEFGSNKWAELVSIAQFYRYPLTEEELKSAPKELISQLPEFLSDITQMSGIDR